MYWYTSHDPTGTTALALAVGLSLLTGFYVLLTGAHQPPPGQRGDPVDGGQQLTGILAAGPVPVPARAVRGGRLKTI